ncbi:MAG: DUF5107 domain-containing protein, partial [Armatimonadetes bacterium]|nr:DUF5107 domain-containing protein [Armatimonadota bacterium]
MKAVTMREGVLELPSYQPGRPDPEPPLLPGFGQNHLPIYPYPTIEWFEKRPSPRRLRTVELENEYLLLVFTPELNGRLYRLYDKLAGAEVLYANSELKPGLVGLRGVWYATGIEVNFPSSHNVTTAEEIACRVLLGDDGSASFVAWDIEATSGMAWECTTTLTPGAAAVTMQTRLANPTDLPHRYYFWVNAAFPIHPGSRYIFPPSTRRIFTEAGLHPGELGYLDYPIHRGCDISRFENLRHASSHFGMTPDEGFFGLHHEHQDTGVAHVADPHLVPGRKIWSWGFAADGQLWHEALSDSSGPYCEVQSGPFRSQIEYRALGPGQELLQREHWLPLRGLGGLSFANESFAAAWTAESGTLGLRLLAARSLPRAVLVVDGREHRLDLSPDDAVLLELPAPEQSRLRLLDAHRNLVGQFDLTPPPARTAPR